MKLQINSTQDSFSRFYIKKKKKIMHIRADDMLLSAQTFARINLSSIGYLLWIVQKNEMKLQSITECTSGTILNNMWTTIPSQQCQEMTGGVWRQLLEIDGNTDLRLKERLLQKNKMIIKLKSDKTHYCVQHCVLLCPLMWEVIQ